MADQGAGQQRPAGWKKDPSGRHFGRWWDGQRWTEHVISAEKVQSIDPITPRAEPVQTEKVAPTRVTPPLATPTEVMPAARVRGPVPTAPGWTPEPESRRGTVPILLVDPADPRGKGENKVLNAIRGWPGWAKWAGGAAVVLLLIAAASQGGEDEDRPVKVVGEVATTLTLPLATTVAPTLPTTTIPATTQAPTTVTIPATTLAPATTAATVPATTAATAPATTAAPQVQQGVTPGAFCSPGGASGVTNTGIPMNCTTSATDSRNRWRAA